MDSPITVDTEKKRRLQRELFKLKRREETEDGEEWKREGGASSAHKIALEKEARLCVPEPLSCDQERWGRRCREHGDQKRENKDKRQARQERTSGQIGRQKPGRGKETHTRWKQDPEQTSRIHSCFPSREVAEDRPFPLQLMKSTFILLKEKAKGRQKPVFLRGELREIQTVSF